MEFQEIKRCMGFERHDAYWRKATEVLNNIIGTLTLAFKNSDIKKQMEDILKRISIESENLRYSDREDRIYVMDRSIDKRERVG